MAESLKSAGEASGQDRAEEAKYPPFDPREAKKKRINDLINPQITEEQAQRENDIDKAWDEAHAAKPFIESAMNVRDVVRLKDSGYPTGMSKEQEAVFDARIKDGEEHIMRQEAMEFGEDISPEDGKTVEERTIKKLMKEATEASERAGREYDEREAKKKRIDDLFKS